MKQCIECGKSLNAGSSSGNAGNVRCLICRTNRALRQPTPRKKARQLPEYVRERETGVHGCILRRVWLIDRTTDTAARLAYVVRFDDGREKRMLTSEVEIVKERTK